MGRKIIGFLIIFIGATLLAAFVYFVFIGNMSFDGIFDKFKNSSDPVVTEQVKTETPTEAKNDTAEIRETNNDPVTIIADVNTDENVDTTDNKNAVDVQKFTKDDLRRMASSFAERFGSFSNHSNFSNIKDLKLYMSKRMSVWADNYVIEKSQSMETNELYYGITTKAVAEEVKDLDEDVGRAVVQVSTRRREATSSTANTSNVFNQEITIVFIKEDGAWKVDDANWQARN